MIKAKTKPKTKKELETENKDLRSQLDSLQSRGDCVLCPVRGAHEAMAKELRVVLAKAIEAQAGWERISPDRVSLLAAAEMAMADWDRPAKLHLPQVAESA